MKTSKTKLAVAVAVAGLVCAAPAIATVMAYRQSSLACINGGGGTFKIVNPSGVPGADWGVVNSNGSSAIAVPELSVICPMGMDVSVSNTALSQPLVSVQMLIASVADVKCTYYLVDSLSGATFTSLDITGNTHNMSVSDVFPTTAPPSIQLANPAQTRQFFLCTLPKATGTTPTAILKAFEVRYGL
jgi:hypothetical protein